MNDYEYISDSNLIRLFKESEYYYTRKKLEKVMKERNSDVIQKFFIELEEKVTVEELKKQISELRERISSLEGRVYFLEKEE